MGLSCPLGIARFVPAKAKFFGVIFWPYNKSFIDQARSVKIAGYRPRSFFMLFGTWTKRTWPISSHLALTLGQQRIYSAGERAFELPSTLLIIRMQTF